MDDVAFASAGELARRIRAREIGCVEALDLTLDRVARIPMRPERAAMLLLGLPPDPQMPPIPGEPLLGGVGNPPVPPVPQPGDPPVGGDAPGDTPLPPVQPPVGDDGVPPVPQPGDAPSEGQGPADSAL